ncbi:Alpha/Beta hydrolase protein [Exophiala viscosa]|uniref:Alpha/Beta hydrolase protein n=1 Tax=Exophiala viscosa TaxID=2486360 RepID=UPI0021997432|nr:Alpha/Beta hydrolase protein [Exophiala viscosa]
MALFIFSLLTGILLQKAASIAVPSKDEWVTIQSALDSNVSLSFKETCLCETTPGVKSYSGYVNLPPDPAEGREYPTHTFFWFFESRKDPSNSPLSLWLQGGPGTPSIPAAVSENGPCLVTADSETTVLNPWSWNNEANMLYIDQPVSTGFSYSTLVNGTVDEPVLPYEVTTYNNSALSSLKTNSTVLAGTFASQNPLSAPNTTMAAARIAWHFMQVWMTEFPAYKPKDNSFSIWGESYGGHYVPTFADYFEAQNLLIANGSLHESAVPLRLDTVGLINGCIDALTQIPTYPQMAYNNTYGIRFINETQYKSAVANFTECQALVEKCQFAAQEYDAQAYGNVTEVNQACSAAYNYCFSAVYQNPTEAGLSMFDITAGALVPFPPKYPAGYLSRQNVQSGLGVPLNFTGLSVPVSASFVATGDFVRGHNLAALGRLLDQGVKVALVYGDSDYQCNWFGGEQISLAINSSIKSKFHNAGYANITTNATYAGGVVRQYGNLSFSRVFQAGHQVPYYQPETAFRIFNRTLSNADVATGETSIGSTFSTQGPSSVFSIKDTPFSHPQLQCYFWDTLETCTSSQKAMMNNGTAIFEDFIMIGYEAANGSAVYY